MRGTCPALFPRPTHKMNNLQFSYILFTFLLLTDTHPYMTMPINSRLNLEAALNPIMLLSISAARNNREGDRNA